jgi:Rrf2 family protein
MLEGSPEGVSQRVRLLSDASEYGLRAVIWLALRPGSTRKVREIAEATHSSPGYLVKVLQSLAKAGILSAQRGAHGGFTLERDPKSLTVLEVLNAIDPIERIRTCPLGIESHGSVLCPMHRRIDDAMGLIENSFANSTIHELMNDPSPSKPLCTVLTVGNSGEIVDPKEP